MTNGQKETWLAHSEWILRSDRYRLQHYKTGDLTGIINIDLEKRTFSGSITALMLAIAGGFAWFGLRETKEDVLEEATKKFEDATKKLAGNVVSVRFSIGPIASVPEFKKLLNGGKLEGSYKVKRKGVALARPGEKLALFVDPVGGAIMAEVEAVPAEEANVIEIVLRETDGARRLWRASESVGVRLINLDLEEGA